jgi:hypothetical protein
VLTHIQLNPNNTEISERKGKLRLKIKGIKTIEEAKQQLEKILNNP